MRRRWIVAGALVLALAFVVDGFTAAPLPPPAPLDAPLPTAAPPIEMTLTRIETGVTHRSAAFAYRGGSFFDPRDFAMTAVLVKHPRGDVLIDSGFGKDVAKHLETLPLFFRAVTTWDRTRSVAEQLDAAGYDRAKLRGVLLTHAHWDHVSGLPELAGTPVWVTAEERRFIEDGGTITALVRGFPGVKYEEYAFEGGPYLGFPRSHDVWGDGSIVVVPAPGHTPGSVAVFVTLASGARWAFVGDLVWQREGITLREERPWFWKTVGDDDPAVLRENLLRVAAIAAKYPQITLAPAHDARGFADIPKL
jgi:glyoxylase-like metal-dependent hydrolase (beta-lactamase superfamily II)